MSSSLAADLFEDIAFVLAPVEQTDQLAIDLRVFEQPDRRAVVVEKVHRPGVQANATERAAQQIEAFLGQRAVVNAISG